jgi:hypothetical protein
VHHNLRNKAITEWLGRSLHMSMNLLGWPGRFCETNWSNCF